jgi:hypothetical protein
MLIPTVPAFVAGDISITKLQQLSQCVSFLTVASSFPVWHVYRASGTQSVPATTWTSISFPATAIDSDGMSSGSSAITVRTQGYYAMEACVPVKTQAAAFNMQVAILFTAGLANPHYTSGTTNRFGYRSGLSWTAINFDESVCVDDVCPVVCYPGDTLAVQLYASVAVVTDANTCSSAVLGRFVTNFTGRWVRQGS